MSDLSLSPDEVWYNNNPNMVTISARCEYNGALVNGRMYSEVFFPNSGGISTGEVDTSLYEYSLYTSFPEAGTYLVRVTCEYNGLKAYASRTFTVHRLDLSLDYSQEIDTYLGDDLDLRLKFKRDSDLVTPKKGMFKAYIGRDDSWQLLEQTEDPILDGSYQHLKLKIPLYSDEISSGLYDLRIDAFYSDDETLSLEKKKLVWVNNPLELYPLDSRIYHSPGESLERNVSCRVVFKAGDLWDLGLENAQARVFNENLSRSALLEDLICDRDTSECDFELSLPNLGPGAYTLELSLAYPSMSNQRYLAKATLPLSEVLELSGSVLDSREEVVSTEITVENQDTGELYEAQTDSKGNYSLSLLPGTYNFIFRFDGGVVARVSDTYLSNLDIVSLPGELVRFDQDHLSSGVPDGIKLVKVMVLEMALPFSEVWVYLPYDSSKLKGDENDLNLYICDRWNFERSVCAGSWTPVEDLKVHTIKDAIEFNSSGYGAFMVGENDFLSISEFDILKKEVYMGDMVSIEGLIVDSEKEPVSGATVTASFPDFGESTSVKSSEEGNFKLTVKAPAIEGDARIFLKAEKDLFVPDNASETVSVSKKKELTILDVPDMIDIPLDEEFDLEFNLMNSGQLDLTDTIYIHLSGISSEWYEIVPNYADGLVVGQEKPFIIRIGLSEELCGGKCNKFYLVNLEAKSQEVSKTASFTLKLPASVVGNTSAASEAEEETTAPAATGFSIALPDMSSPYLPMTAIVLLLLLIVNKQKSGGGGFGKQGKTGHNVRSSTMSSFKKIRKQI